MRPKPEKKENEMKMGTWAETEAIRDKQEDQGPHDPCLYQAMLPIWDTGR